MHVESTTVNRLPRWLLGAALICQAGCDTGTPPDVPLLDLQQRTQEPLPCAPQARPPSPGVLLFGFDPRASLEEDTRQYLPFLSYLEETTGLRFKLHFSGNRPVAEELGENQVDFAAIGATSYILAREHHGVVPLVRGLNDHGKAEYRSKIVVRPDSPLGSLQDLHAQRFAFGNADSTQGHLIPRILLSKAGLSLDDLKSYSYTGSHRNCADAVASGKADACGMQDNLADLLAAQGVVRILHVSDYYPSSGIAAGAGVPQDIVDRVRDALLAFDPKGKDHERLYHWERTEMPGGFIPADPDDYAELRRWMINFDMLKPKADTTAGEHDAR